MSLSRRCAAIILSAMMPAVAVGTPASAQAPHSTSRLEEVRFPSEPGTMLAGTLEMPHEVHGSPRPVVVIIAGTGPWTRGGWVNIRARLLADGIATLMYDKRGQGQSTGAFVDTVPATERDVAAAIAYLRTRRDVDPRRIALLGTSQGAVAAPLVASRDPEVAAVVMLSGPVGPRGELFLEILRSHLRSAGKDPTQIESVSSAVGRWMEGRSRHVEAALLTPLRDAATAAFVGVGFSQAEAQGFVATLDNDVVLSMFEAAPAAALAALPAPVLAIFGSNDDVIAPAQSIAAAAAALRSHRDALVMLVPGMTHELTRATPAPTDPPLADGTMPVVTEMVGTWLAKRLNPSGSVR